MQQRENIAWIDWLRIIACFFVVLAHCVDPFVMVAQTNYSDFLAGAFWGSFLRPCVPLFVMVTAILLLPVDMSMGQFYRKRLSKVLWPLLTWSILLPITFYLYVNYGGTYHPAFVEADYSAAATGSKLLTWPLNFNYDITPLWYIYMLVGIYLILPVVSSWLRQASKRDMQIFLLIWICSTCLPYLTLAAPVLGYTGNWGNMDLFGECTWNTYGTFYYFSGFLGYVVLAFYLKRFPLQWSRRKTIVVGGILFLVGYAITLGGFIVTQSIAPDNYAALEVPWWFSGLNVMISTTGAYLMISSIKVKSNPTISRIAGLTFGVYLAHFIVVHIAYDLFYNALSMPAALKIPVMGIFSFAVTLFVVWVLSKLPFRKYLIG